MFLDITSICREGEGEIVAEAEGKEEAEAYGDGE